MVSFVSWAIFGHYFLGLLHISFTWLKTLYTKKKIESYHIDAFSDKAIDTIGAGDAVFAFTSLMSKINSKINQNAFVSNLAGALKIQILGHEDHIKKINFMKSLDYLLK